MAVGSKSAVPVLFALLVGGCPKRQTGPHIVYVQPPPTATALAKPAPGAPAEPETLTIEEPPPVPIPVPPPAAPAPAATAQNQPAVKKPPRKATDSHASEEPAPTAEAGTAQVPSLEPASGASSEEEVQALQGSVWRRIDGLPRTYYSTPADRQTLEDVRSFVNQSELALKAHDLLKARELADKASLLLRALEPKP